MVSNKHDRSMQRMTEITGLERLLTPISVSEFELYYFERMPLVVQREGAESYSSLLSLTEFEALLFTVLSQENQRSFRIVKAGQVLPMKPPLVNDSGDLQATQVLLS